MSAATAAATRPAPRRNRRTCRRRPARLVAPDLEPMRVWYAAAVRELTDYLEPKIRSGAMRWWVSDADPAPAVRLMNACAAAIQDDGSAYIVGMVSPSAPGLLRENLYDPDELAADCLAVDVMVEAERRGAVAPASRGWVRPPAPAARGAEQKR